MPVGDVNSESRGSGARYNDGKVDLTLLPTEAWWQLAQARGLSSEEKTELAFLEEFWLGDDGALQYLIENLSEDDLIAAAEVFAYGAQKYAAWNWAKGMEWSVPVGCYLRHMLHYDDGPQDYDRESGLLHRGHAVCNLLMLQHFLLVARDLDDRPVELQPQWHEAQKQKAARESAEQVGADTPGGVSYGEPNWDLTLRAWGDPTIAWDQTIEPIIGYRSVEGETVIAFAENLPTTLLNDLSEVVAEELESRERTLATTGILR